jgi:hypothetical protein
VNKLVLLVNPIFVKLLFVREAWIVLNATLPDSINKKLINHVPVTGILNAARPFPLPKLPVVHPYVGELTIKPMWPEEEGAEPNVLRLYALLENKNKYKDMPHFLKIKMIKPL